MGRNDAPKAAADFAARVRAVQGLQARAGRSITAAVQGHRGESTVTVSTTGSGARVSIVGPDAAEQRDAVHQAAQAALRKER